MSNALPIARAVAAKVFKSPADQARFVAQMNQEAHGEDLTSPAGAAGYAQIMPATAAAWGVKNVHDPAQAYTAAATHMAGYLSSYGGDWSKALTAYNAGPGAVGKPLPAETQNYIKTILGSKGATSGATASVPAPASRPATTSTSFDQAGYEKAQKLAVLGQLLSRDHQGGALFKSGVLTTQMPDPASFQQAVTVAAQAAPKTSNSVLAGGSAPAAKGLATYGDAKVAAWIAPALEYAKSQGWQGSVTSGYRSLADQTRIYNSGVRPAAKPGTSNHEMTAFPGGAVDVSNAAQLSSILQKSKYAKLLVWAGAKDPVHFSHPRNGTY